MHIANSHGRALLIAAAFLASAIPASAPALAQVACPPGYGWNGYGCVPVAPVYAAPPPPVYVEPSPEAPVFDALALAFGGDHHDDHRDRYRHDDHHHYDHHR